MPIVENTGSRLDEPSHIAPQHRPRPPSEGGFSFGGGSIGGSSGGGNYGGGGGSAGTSGVGGGSASNQLRGDVGADMFNALAGYDVPAYDRLYFVTFTANTGSLSLTIPSQYAALQIKIAGRTIATGATSEAIRMRYNGDLSAVYRYATVGSLNGSSDIVQNYAGATSMLVGVLPTADSPAGAAGKIDIDADYLQSAFHKCLTADAGGYFDTTPTNGIGTWSSFNTWGSTAPVFSLTLFPETTSFASGTCVRVYGIR